MIVAKPAMSIALTTKFQTPEEAELAFYDAIERRDIEALGQVWSMDENIVCIHPGSHRIEGRRNVLQSFVDLFGDAPSLGFSLCDALHTGNEHLAIHLVREEIELEGQLVSVMMSTNIFHFENGGWRMLLHHASHEPDDDYDDLDDELGNTPLGLDVSLDDLHYDALTHDADFDLDDADAASEPTPRVLH